ncbi:MAG: molybdopterin-guanine dinucleotide biosynthesis protein B [Gammaproteobacteria bacterium]|nr:molybdopterin-guanine dinucleotide biosynthesis protein B [Gammaproteobacteria bacterium]
MSEFPVPVLGIVAWSGTGKTSLLERLIPELRDNGIRVAAIKHSHHDFEIDKQGKDSDKLRKAGAGQIILTSKYRTAIIIEEDRETEPDLFQQLSRLDAEKLDLVLVEGFRQVDIPKIEVYRPSLEKPMLCLQDRNIVALACDEQPQQDVAIEVLPLNDERAVSAFVTKWINSL